MKQETIHQDWTILEKWLFQFITVFTILFVVSFSFSHYLLPDVGQWLSPLFETLASWTAQYVFLLHPPYTIQLISDSTGFYINVFNIAVVAFLFSSIWSLMKSNSKDYLKWQYFLFVFLRYYLAMQMLAYGWSKIFKWQFYLPEPNLLFTPLGELSHDILYWSTMGISRSYTIFGGILELIIAILLLFRKTRLLGALIGIGVMTNVVLINFSYNISVKLYSSILLLLFMVLVLPDAKQLFAFFIKNEVVEKSKLWSPQYHSTIQIRTYRMVKTLIIGILLIDSLGMYVEADNFNDDRSPRPPYHGAYVVQGILEKVPQSSILNDLVNTEKLFIHRRGYLIIQNNDGKTQDFKMNALDENYYKLTRMDLNSEIDLKIIEKDSLYRYTFSNASDTIILKSRSINWQELPLMKREFHWTIDDFH